MNTELIRSPFTRLPERGLAGLDAVPLTPHHRAGINLLGLHCGGSQRLQHRKLTEAARLFALEQVSSRFRIAEMRLTDGLQVRFALDVPVPCMPDQNGRLVVQSPAILAMDYCDEAFDSPQPGTSFIAVLQPRAVHHPNVAVHPLQPLCLGPILPAGIRATELVIMTYQALAMQNLNVDELSAEGVLNDQAAIWWQQNLDKVPLTREPFLSAAAKGGDGEGGHHP